ncbi:hypothetical protein Fmac_001333 [Flemingia macrophylla]|uniref:Uncharacterized protein n=1 Tax=Flemingia macrophylla TaxID=520843 RepID=A0ABD1NHI9_9FABA
MLNLFRFTSRDPSQVSAKVSHICFALLKLCTFVYSSSKSAHMMELRALEFTRYLCFFSSIHLALGISSRFSS